MSSVPAEMIWNFKEIEDAFQQAAGRGTGCEGRTAFGKTKLDLTNLNAAQALLLARATSGQESADWQAAVRWLEEIEKDARSAEMEARQAVGQARSGFLDEALRHVRLACEIESKHHQHLRWGPLHQLIKRACAGAADF